MSESHPKSKPVPFWENAPLITFVTSLVVGAFTLGKYIEEHYRAKTETEIADKQRQHEIRLKYLGIALQPEYNLKQSDKVLRFLTNIDDDMVLNNWARGELKNVQRDLNVIKERDSVRLLLNEYGDSLGNLKSYTLNLKNQEDSTRLRLSKELSTKENIIASLKGAINLNKRKLDSLNQKTKSSSPGVNIRKFDPYSFADDYCETIWITNIGSKDPFLKPRAYPTRSEDCVRKGLIVEGPTEDFSGTITWKVAIGSGFLYQDKPVKDYASIKCTCEDRNYEGNNNWE